MSSHMLPWVKQFRMDTSFVSQWGEERRKGNVSPFEFCICPMSMSKPVEPWNGSVFNSFLFLVPDFSMPKVLHVLVISLLPADNTISRVLTDTFTLEKIFKFYKVEVELNQVNHRLTRFQKVYQGKMKIFMWQQMFEQKSFSTLGNTTLVYTMD